MSKRGKDVKEDLVASKVDNPSKRVQNISFDSTSTNEDAQTIVINLFSSSYPRKERSVGSGFETIEDLDKENRIKTTESKCTSYTLFGEGNENLTNEYQTPRSDASRDDSVMDNRKQMSDYTRSPLNGRAKSDLERKMLEAELKAAEEIARIKQSVIEKRLALELASLKDNPGLQQSSVQGASPNVMTPDIKTIEEMADKNQRMIERNLAQELSMLAEYQNQNPDRYLPTLSVPAAPPPSPPRQNPNVSGGVFKSEHEFSTSSYSDFRPVPPPPNPRKMAPLNMKVMRSDFRHPTANRISPMPSNITPMQARYMSPNEVRYLHQMEDRSLGFSQQAGQSKYDDPSLMVNRYNPPSFWKRLMTQVKKRFKQNKAPETWEN